MATLSSCRVSNVKSVGRRSFRKRRESEEENIYLDLDRDHTELVQEILFHVLKQDVSKSRKLGYLNGFVRLLQTLQSCSNIGYTYKDIFCCIRVSLFHEACEVRAAGLRVCRYLLHNIEATDAFCEMKLHFLVARSLDLALENRVERIHALRLVRKFLCVNPLAFPNSFANCLVAIINEGGQERDLVKACLATLAQLSVLNPEVCALANGISSLLRSVMDCQQPQIVEAVLGVILFLFNDSKTRKVLKNDLGLEHFLAPFTDCHYRYPCEILDNAVSVDRETKLAATRLAVVSVLRSWSGMTYMFRTDHHEFSTLIDMLYLPYADMRKNIVDLMFEVFDLPLPEWTDDFSIAILSADPSTVFSSWELFEGYIVAEGNSVLPYLSKNRTNLMDNYFALLLLLFVQEGLLEALAEVIVSAEINLVVRCTVLLGELLCMCNQYLPSDCCHLCNCLPSLISTAASFHSQQEQNHASAAITCLFRIHELKKRGCITHSLVLNNLLHICSSDKKNKNIFTMTVSKAKLYHYIKKDMSETINQALKDTLVLSEEEECWDWDLVSCILKNSVDVLKKTEDANSRYFLQRLLAYFKPSSKEFSEVKFDAERAEQIIVTSYHFMEFLLEMDEVNSQEYLDDFLMDLNNCIDEVTKDIVPLDTVLSPAKLSSTLSHAFFLLIGKLSSSHKGCKFLGRCGTFQNLFRLVSVTNLDIYIKLIVSALDYSKEGFARTIFSKVLTGTIESSRLYATNYLRVLLRAGLPDYRKWAIEFLVTQLYDPCSRVSHAAVDILDEACNSIENLETLISLRPSLIHLEDKGLLLRLRFLSVPTGFRFLRDAKFLHYAIEKWKKNFNLKYVKIVEDLLNEALTRHRRGEDGTYGRRSSDTKHTVNSVYVPHHMYGQLAQHSEGLEVLLNEVCLQDLFSTLSDPDYSSELSVLHLKAAIWAVGHIGSCPLGLPIIVKEGILLQIVQLAAEAPVLSVRGTCFFCLGLLSSTSEGIQLLNELGWKAVCHNRIEKWSVKSSSLDHIPSLSHHRSSVDSNDYEWPLGGLPYSLSFIVQNSNANLSSSQSFNSLDAENSKTSNSSSFSSTTSIQLTNNMHDVCTRPRSSSDCQPNCWKETYDEMKMETSSWNSLSPKNISDVVFKERSVSSYEVGSHSFSLQADATSPNCNGSSQTCPIDISVSQTGFSNNISSRKTFSSHQLQASLSPIPSYASVNTTLQYSDENGKHPSVLRQMSRGHSCYVGSPPSLDNSEIFTFASIRDAEGYTTLKNIQRRSVQSLCVQNSTSYNIDYGLIEAEFFSSMPLSTSPYTTWSSENHSFSKTNISSKMLSQASDTVEKPDSDADGENNQKFIGLCLPSNLDLLFSDISMDVNNDIKMKFFWKKQEDTDLLKLKYAYLEGSGANSKACNKVPKESKSFPDNDTADTSSSNENTALEFHTVRNCLASHSSCNKAGLSQTTIDEEVEEASITSVEIENVSKNREIKNPATKRNNQRCKVTTKITEDSPEGQLLVRKEIIRYVTNLGSSVAVQASEQGLLNMKQKFPSAFQDICLYTEICLYMAKYSFRLPARRFFQELFLDIGFEELQREAESVIGVTSLLQKSGASDM